MIGRYPISIVNFIFTIIVLIFFWAISLLTNQLAFTYFSAFFGTIISFFYLLKFFNGILNPFKFLRIASISLIFSTNLTWIISGIFVFLYYKTDLFSFLKNMLGINHESYLGAIIFTLIFSLVLFFFSLNKKLILEENYVANKVRNATEINNKIIFLIITVIVILEIYLINTGFIEYRTFDDESFKLGIISPWIPYLNYIFHFHIGLLALLIYKNEGIKFNLKNYILIICSLLILGLIFFSRGRFRFFFSYIELAFWYCFFKNHLPKLKTIIIALFIFLPILYNLTLFNQFLRNSINPFDDFKSKNLLSTIQDTYENWKFGSEKKIVVELTTENFTDRFLSLYPLAQSLELKSNEKDYLLGENIFNNLIWAIPRIIYPGKTNFPIGERLMYENFALSFSDTSNSIYLFSYLDFWYFGLFLYPLLFFFYWKLLLFLITIKDFNPLVLIFVLTNLLLLFFNLAEGSLLAYLDVLRNIAILLFVLIIFTKKKKIQESKKSS